MPPSKLPVALYVPNLLGYVRIILSFVALHLSTTQPVQTVAVWFVSGWLDLFDGKLARALDQCSRLGVLLDILADNILRMTVWIAAASDPSYSLAAAFVIALEWTTMLATQLHAEQAGVHWKNERENDPWLLKAVFANNFANPLGIFVFYGLFTSGAFAYASRYPIFEEYIPHFKVLQYLSFAGRGASVLVEFWLCKGYFSMVVGKDSNKDA
mmetsp:Transcript_19060/g.54135  ORF Transcript_19060/g.54135 Transcript_19060/m.54135 type:complete len:212 (-) Transcript_19060:1243-1878(-)